MKLAERRGARDRSRSTRWTSAVGGGRPRQGQLREALWLLFCDPLPKASAKIRNLPTGRWRKLLRWLDYSGLALYFLNRMRELQLTHWIPEEMLEQLNRNQIDNAERTRTLIAESIEIQERFQAAGLRYVLLKGISLWPFAVPRPELRCQFDLDFLIAEADAVKGREILEERGYHLYPGHGESADVGSKVTWEFKWNERPGNSVEDIYKPMPSFAVELHIEPKAASRSLIAGGQVRELSGFSTPVLSPEDLLITQGLHAFKHVCRAFYRLSNLLEFRRHVLFRCNDAGFWARVHELLENDPMAMEQIATVIALLTEIGGEFAPPDLTSWTSTHLHPVVRSWIEIYGRRTAFTSFPGTKLYVLLPRVQEDADFVRKRLMPLHLPRAPVRSFPQESAAIRVARYRMYVHQILTLLPLHILGGMQFIWEAWRFRRRLAALSKA